MSKLTFIIKTSYVVRSYHYVHVTRRVPAREVYLRDHPLQVADPLVVPQLLVWLLLAVPLPVEQGPDCVQCPLRGERASSPLRNLQHRRQACNQRAKSFAGREVQIWAFFRGFRTLFPLWAYCSFIQALPVSRRKIFLQPEGLLTLRPKIRTFVNISQLS